MSTPDYKPAIIENIISLLNKNYEIRLTKHSISVIEPYKSECRDKWIEKEVRGIFGGRYWEDGWLRITLEKLQEFTRDLTPEDEEKNPANNK